MSVPSLSLIFAGVTLAVALGAGVVMRSFGYEAGWKDAVADERHVPVLMERFGFCPSYRPKEGREWKEGCAQ